MLRLTGAAKTTKKVEGGYFDKLDSAIYILFRQEREKGCQVSGPILLEKLLEKTFRVTEGYSEHQIFDCDETGLYFRMLPGHTLESVHKRQGDNKCLCKH